MNKGEIKQVKGKEENHDAIIYFYDADHKKTNSFVIKESDIILYHQFRKSLVICGTLNHESIVCKFCLYEDEGILLRNILKKLPDDQEVIPPIYYFLSIGSSFFITCNKRNKYPILLPYNQLCKVNRLFCTTLLIENSSLHKHYHYSLCRKEYYDYVLLMKKESQSCLDVYHFGISQKIALKILYSVLQNIEYLHQYNIIHGDIKLENLLVKFLNHQKKEIPMHKIKDDVIIKTYLIDFGLAMIEDPLFSSTEEIETTTSALYHEYFLSDLTYDIQRIQNKQFEVTIDKSLDLYCFGLLAVSLLLKKSIKQCLHYGNIVSTVAQKLLFLGFALYHPKEDCFILLKDHIPPSYASILLSIVIPWMNHHKNTLKHIKSIYDGVEDNKKELFHCCFTLYREKRDIKKMKKILEKILYET